MEVEGTREVLLLEIDKVVISIDLRALLAQTYGSFGGSDWVQNGVYACTW